MSLEGQTGKNSKKYILLLTYNHADLLKLSIYLRNRYLIDNLVIMIRHGHYMSLYIYYKNTHRGNYLNLTLVAQFQEAEGRPLCMSTVAVLYIDWFIQE